jgi:steroid delta-isomerase-like uncharacterized protein
MTETQAAALIRRYYDAFNAGDPDGMVACLAPDFVHDVNEGSRRDGRAAFREFLTHMNRCYRERLTQIVVMASPDGTRGAAEFVVEGEYLETDPGLPEANGQRYVLPAGAFFAVSLAGITRVTTYYNLKNWIAQVSA